MGYDVQNRNARELSGSCMKEFDELLEVARILNSPGGCPWDLKQTFFSLQPYVLEEAHEVVEAVDGQNDKEIIEELGDLLYTVVFYAKVAEKESRFSMEEILKAVKDKLIRRHPHIFGSVKVENETDVEKNWDLIKKTEEGKSHRVSDLDGIPNQLPLLAKSQKMMKVFAKKQFVNLEFVPKKEEAELTEDLFTLIKIAEKSGIDIESTFRRKLSDYKKEFLEREKEGLLGPESL